MNGLLMTPNIGNYVSNLFCNIYVVEDERPEAWENDWNSGNQKTIWGYEKE